MLRRSRAVRASMHLGRVLCLVLFAWLLVPGPSPAQDVRALRGPRTDVRAWRRVRWESPEGPVDLRITSRDRAVTLAARTARRRLEHTFEGIHWGEPLHARYTRPRHGVLEIRIHEMPPSLGWPRFAACARLVASHRGLMLVDAAEPAEFGCRW
jgi:hypothetical protein